MKTTAILGLGLAAALSASASPYLTVEVGYDFGVTSTSGAYFGDPDTGFVKVITDGSSTFVGSVELWGVSNFAGTVDDLWTGTIGPSDSVYVLSGYEGSNAGGFNGPYGDTDLGILLKINGLLDGQPLNWQAYDGNIHSGTYQTNPFGEFLDNYILQGGSSIGWDTEDDFEMSQAHALFLVIPDQVPVPEVNAPALLIGAGIAASIWNSRRRQHRA